LIYQGFYRS